MNNNNDIDITKLMEMLSKMDKKDLEKGMAQASQIIGKSSVEEMLKKIKK